MSEQTPYEKLGLTEAASFEEIQEAKNRLSQEHSDDIKVVESIEAAYDAIIMERLKMRQEGRIKVPDRIRFPEKKVELPISPPPLSFSNSPSWLNGFIDTPSTNDILWPGGIFLGLAILAGILGSNSSGLSLLLSLGVFVNVYFLNRKGNKLGRSLLITIVGLLLGVGLGIGFFQLLRASNLLQTLNLVGDVSQLLISFTVFFVFWLISSFLR